MQHLLEKQGAGAKRGISDYIRGTGNVKGWRQGKNEWQILCTCVQQGESIPGNCWAIGNMWAVMCVAGGL